MVKILKVINRLINYKNQFNTTVADSFKKSYRIINGIGRID